MLSLMGMEDSMWLINFLTRFFKKPVLNESVIDQEAVAPPIIPEPIIVTQPIEPTEEIPVIVEEFPKLIPIANPRSHTELCFLHSKRRVKERYGFTLDQHTYDFWHRLIKDNNDSRQQFLFIEGTSEVYRIDYGPCNVIVVYKDGMIRTVLPPENYKNYLTKDIKKVFVKTGKIKAKDVGKDRKSGFKDVDKKW